MLANIEINGKAERRVCEYRTVWKTVAEDCEKSSRMRIRESEMVKPRTIMITDDCHLTRVSTRRLKPFPNSPSKLQMNNRLRTVTISGGWAMNSDQDIL
jgi:hypothetical protein